MKNDEQAVGAGALGREASVQEEALNCGVVQLWLRRGGVLPRG